MDRAAVFVDAGYLFAAGSKLIAGEKLSRGELRLDYDEVVRTFESLARELTGLPLLRIYWYDGTATGPTPQQLTLAYRPSIKMRLGFVNQQGQQKGVDSLIVTDLISLARNRAMADAVLLTGDEDIRVGVQQAQEFGVRVHLLGIEPARENQSGFLVQEADGVRELGRAEVEKLISKAAPITSAHPPTVTAAAVMPSASGLADVSARLTAVARQLASELTTEERDAVLKESVGGSVPTHIDRRLLTNGGNELSGALLTPEQKRNLRSAFRAACKEPAS